MLTTEKFEEIQWDVLALDEAIKEYNLLRDESRKVFLEYVERGKPLAAKIDAAEKRLATHSDLVAFTPSNALDAVMRLGRISPARVTMTWGPKINENSSEAVEGGGPGAERGF